MKRKTNNKKREVIRCPDCLSNKLKIYKRVFVLRYCKCKHCSARFEITEAK